MDCLPSLPRHDPNLAPTSSVWVSERALRRRALLAPKPVDVPTIPTSIRTASLNDLAFLDHLQKTYTNCLGFLPRVALEWYAETAHVRLAEENGQAAGYILGHHRLRWQPLLRPIYQAAVAMDATRRHHGLALLAVIEAEARAAGQIGLQANCAAELEANEFWKAAGFIPIACLTPINRRGRDLICWRKPLVRNVPSWFADLPKRAGHKAAASKSSRASFIQNHAKEGKSHALVSFYTPGR